MLIKVCVEESYILHMIEAQWWTSPSVFQRLCGKRLVMPMDKTEKRGNKKLCRSYISLMKCILLDTYILSVISIKTLDH